jgi:hypothetical protein
LNLTTENKYKRKIRERTEEWKKDVQSHRQNERETSPVEEAPCR